MNNKFKNPKSFLALAFALALTACGGGGGGGGGGGDSYKPEERANDPVNTGSVDAPFNRQAASRYFLWGVGTQTNGALIGASQDASGAMTTLATSMLTGITSKPGAKPATQEIAGNVDFAQGRWNFGTAVVAGGQVIMDGTSNESFHYLAFNDLAALPKNVNMTCDAGKFTKPSYVGGSAASDLFGSASGTASVAFDGTSAQVTLSITASTPASNATVALNGTIASTNDAYIVGGIGGLNSGGAVALANEANNGVRIVTAYRAKLGNGAVYQGVASFSCKQ